MTLDNLLGRMLEAIEPDALTIQRLLDAAARNIKDAKLEALSNENLPTRPSCNWPTLRCRPTAFAP